jgi:ubiquinone/menaquinone biosynthesis C-methylase UbiE
MDQIENHWDRFSKLYDRQADSLAAATFQLWNMLRVREVESMVECGCGTGYLLPFLVEQKRP